MALSCVLFSTILSKWELVSYSGTISLTHHGFHDE